MATVKHKVLAYVTDGHRLLVFRHPDSPEAGIQAPGGTVEPGEAWDAAALREAVEETGLAGLVLERRLGERVRHWTDSGRDEIQIRHFYHLRCTTPPPASWEHAEWHPSDGSPAPIRFAFFWAALPSGVPPLVADQGALLPELCAALGLDPPPDS